MKKTMMCLAASMLFLVPPLFGQDREAPLFSTTSDYTKVAIEIAGVKALPVRLTSSEATTFNRTVEQFKKGERDKALEQWNGLTRGLSNRGVKIAEVSALINWLLRKAYLETDRALLFQAEKLYYLNKMKEDLGEYLEELKRQLSSRPSRVRMRVIDSVPDFRPGEAVAITWKLKDMNTKEIEDEIASRTRQMQEMIQSYNLQYLQLQQKMQGDNRQFTMMSNIMKTKHDTAKNAISNIR